MEITDAVLDTNTLYHPKELRRIAATGRVRLWGSVANVIEVVSDIVDAETFKEVRSQLLTLETVAPRCYLPDPDTAFKHDLGLKVSLEDAAQWKKLVVQPICEAESLEELPLNLDRIRQRRADHAIEFDNGVKEMIRSINHDASFDGDNWTVNLKGRALDEFLTWLWSIDGKKELVAAWFAREGWADLVMPVESWKRGFVILEPYYRAYRGYVAEIIRRNIKHQKNDALDFDFLIPVWRPGWVFVTQENRVKTFLRAGEMEENKFMTVQELDSRVSETT